MQSKSKIADRIRFVRKAIGFVFRYASRPLRPGRFRAPWLPQLSIENTNVCNADCVFCANSVMQRRKQPLDMALFRKAVDEHVRSGATQVWFNVTIGEPLLDPYFLERARYVASFPQIVDFGFITTLQWLHRFDLDEFFRCRFTWVSVSTTLSGRERYKEFFRVDKYDQMIANLVALLDHNRALGRPINITVDVKPTNEMREDVLHHPDFRRIDDLTDGTLARRFRKQEFYSDNWQGAVQLPSFIPLRPLTWRAHRPCQMLYSGLMLYSNGNVGACACRDFEASSELILGNVANASLSEMWHGAKLQQIRSDWLRSNRVPEICQSCRHYVH